MNSQLTSPPTELLQIITPEQAWHYRIVPLERSNGTIVFNIDASQASPGTDSELELLLGTPVALVPCEAEKISVALSTHYRKGGGAENGRSPRAALPGSDDFLEHLIDEAQALGSSDIHIERYEARCRVRFRIDGRLVERYTVAPDSYATYINKIKIKANLDISEKRLPQDGRICFSMQSAQHTAGAGANLDLRVSVLPAMHGEKVVLRLLSKDAADVDMARLGFSQADMERYLEGIRKPEGIILISGPTGSGKTTTLYATLKLLNKETCNIVTIEDPVEYTLEGINQVQLRDNIGLSFARALRTFLRQDPDIIMLGEIRDAETASMAVRASLTGHLVLSTIHTNSAWGTVSRLANMGIPPFLIAGTLSITMAQRLVRLLCEHCRQRRPWSDVLLPHGFIKPLQPDAHYTPSGCEQCHFTGYRGRKAIFEVIPVDEHLASMIRTNQSDITQWRKEKEIKTLAENAFGLLAAGQTSVEEVYPLMMNMG